jgi:hypothetical protein
MTSRDADKKRTLLAAWCTPLLPGHSLRLCDRVSSFDTRAALLRLATLPTAPSIYILLADINGEATPVYIGKSDEPATRWRQHIDGWMRGTGSYARWREALLDSEERIRYDLTLLVVPAEDIVVPPLPGFPTSVGSVEYQLVGLASDAFPGRLLNSEGQGRC